MDLKQKKYIEISLVKESFFAFFFAILFPLFCMANFHDNLFVSKNNHLKQYTDHSYEALSKTSTIRHIKDLTLPKAFTEYTIQLIDPLEPMMRGVKAQHGFEMRNRRRLQLERTESFTQDTGAEEDKEGERQEEERESSEEEREEREEREKRSERSERTVEYSSLIHSTSLEFLFSLLYPFIQYLKTSNDHHQFKLFEFIRYSYSPRSPPAQSAL